MEPKQLDKAAQNYIAGSQNARTAWEQGFARYRAVLSRLRLPKRGKVGSKVNWRRNQLICAALHAEKMRQHARCLGRHARTRQPFSSKPH